MMFTPIEFLTEEEIKEQGKRLRALGEKGLIKELIKKGWSKASAQQIAETMLRASSPTPHHTQLSENLRDSQSDSALNSQEEGR